MGAWVRGWVVVVIGAGDDWELEGVGGWGSRVGLGLGGLGIGEGVVRATIVLRLDDEIAVRWGRSWAGGWKDCWLGGLLLFAVLLRELLEDTVVKVVSMELGDRLNRFRRGGARSRNLGSSALSAFGYKSLSNTTAEMDSPSRRNTLHWLAKEVSAFLRSEGGDSLKTTQCFIANPAVKLC